MTIIIVCAAIIIDNARKISYDSEVTESLSNEFIENFGTGYFIDFFDENSNFTDFTMVKLVVSLNFTEFLFG